jgi:hypothetical protein
LFFYFGFVGFDKPFDPTSSPALPLERGRVREGVKKESVP